MPKFRYSVFSLYETKHETLEAKDEALSSYDVKKVLQPQPQHMKVSTNNTGHFEREGMEETCT